MSEFKRIPVGQPLLGWPSISWDAVGDGLDKLRTLGPPTGDQPTLGTPVDPLKIVNKHSADLTKPFGILKLDGPLNDPAAFADEPYQGVRLVGSAPDSDTEKDLRFGILQAACDQDGSVDVVVLGPSWVKVDIQDETNTAAMPVADDTEKLKGGNSGVPIVWKEEGTGEKWAIVMLGGGGGSSRTVGTASGFALCVTDIPAGSIPDLTGVDVADWTVTPGQAGPPADRESEFGEGGATPVAWNSNSGVVLLDWKRDYDKEDLSTYADAPYIEPKVDWAPIVEKFGDGGLHEGGGLGGSEGGGTGAGGGNGGGI